MGADIAKAALAAGNAVVATGRNTDAVAEAVGEADNLLVVKLDVTSRADAEAAAHAAVRCFGRIDVMVNNAGNFYAGYFEELMPEQIERQLATSLLDPMNVTRAVPPVMRKQRSGHIISISSTAGPVSFEFCSDYAASKFGLEDWMESPLPRSRRSTSTPPSSTRDSSAPSSSRRSRSPSEEPPPRRVIAGADAITLAEQKVADLQAQIDAYHELSTSLALDDRQNVGVQRWSRCAQPSCRAPGSLRRSLASRRIPLPRTSAPPSTMLPRRGRAFPRRRLRPGSRGSS
jgi:hypothetical protein